MDTANLSPELLLAQSRVFDRAAKIEEALKTHDPMVAIHCEEIRKALMEHEELIHILPEDQVRIYVAGMMRYKNIKLVEEASKTRKKGKVTAEDL